MLQSNNSPNYTYKLYITIPNLILKLINKLFISQTLYTINVIRARNVNPNTHIINQMFKSNYESMTYKTFRLILATL